MDLATTLQRLARAEESRYGLHISTEVPGKQNISHVVASGLYAITQEALTNVAKHSGCHEAVIRLRLAKEKSCLVIEDHGCGFNPETISDQRGHLGLAGMSERAREMGWTLVVKSQPSRGTCVRVSEPSTGEVE